MNPMQTVHNVLQWSFYLSGMTGLMVLAGIFTSWLSIEILVALVDITA